MVIGRAKPTHHDSDTAADTNGRADAIRILAIIAVVLGHIADMPMFSPPRGVGSSDWWISNIINSLCRWAVPVFVMLSGSRWLSSTSSSSMREFYLDRFSRVGIPLVIWSAFYMWFSVSYTGWVSRPQAVTNLLQGHPYPHLHFVAVISGLYLFTPMFYTFVQHATKEVLWVTVILCLIFATGNSLTSVALNSPPNIFSRFVPFVGYYLAGFLLKDVKLSTKQLYAAVSTVVALTVLISASTGYFALRDGMRLYPSWAMAAYDFASPPRILYGILSWLILTHIFNTPLTTNKRVRKFISYWARLTFGIYLIHPAIRDFLHCGINEHTPYLHRLPEWLWFEGWQTTKPSIWIGVTSEFAVVYVLSIALVMAIQRLPILRRAFG